MKNRFLTLFALLACAAPLCAQSPTATVKATTDKVLVQLQDPKVQGDAHKIKRRQIVRDAMEGAFAWDKCAQLCLGKHWRARTAQEKADFTRIFSQFLKESYSEKIATYYTDLAKLEYKGEKVEGDDFARVNMVITTKSKTVHPVEYRMTKIGGQWKAYDVLIEGVSLVSNYRSQFDAIITKSSFADLLEQIRNNPIVLP